jgi:uncharacterized protein (UPF0332 family)
MNFILILLIVLIVQYFMLQRHYYLKKELAIKHIGTIRQFGLEYVINDNFDKEISKFFTRIEEDRIKADYDLTFEFSKLKAKKRFNQSKRFC